MIDEEEQKRNQDGWGLGILIGVMFFIGPLIMGPGILVIGLMILGIAQPEPFYLQIMASAIGAGILAFFSAGIAEASQTDTSISRAALGAFIVSGLITFCLLSSVNFH